MPTGTSGGGSLQVEGAPSLRRRMFPDDFVLELHFDDEVATAAFGSDIFGLSSSLGGPTDKSIGLSPDAECCKRAGSVASTESCGSAEMSPLDLPRGRELVPSWGRAGSSESVESEGLCGGRDVSSAGRRQRFCRQPRTDLEDELAGGGASSSEEGEALSSGAAVVRRRYRRFPSFVVAVAGEAGGPLRARPASRISAAAARLQASSSGNGRRGLTKNVMTLHYTKLTGQEKVLQVDDTETD
jgi:hypothetical protein